VPFSSGDTALIKNLYRFKNAVLENTGKIFEDKLQQKKMGMLLTKIWETCSIDQRQWNKQTEAHTYWKKCDHCGWNGRLAKPQRPETNIAQHTRYLKKNWTKCGIVHF